MVTTAIKFCEPASIPFNRREGNQSTENTNSVCCSTGEKIEQQDPECPSTNWQDTAIDYLKKNDGTSLQKWSLMDLSKPGRMRYRQAAKEEQHHCHLSKLPRAKLNFALRATLNINDPVFLFVRHHQNHLAILTFALCYICWPIKISSGVSRAWNAVILSKLRLVCPNYAANTSMSCGVIKMARWTLNWRAIKYAAWLKSSSNILDCDFMHFYRT